MPRPSASPRLALLLMTLLALTTLTTCGSAPTPCPSPGKSYSQKILVERRDGSFTDISVALVCAPDKTVAIVDSNGDEYTSLDDFRAGNKILGRHDKIIIPKYFPAVEQPREDFELVTFSARIIPPWAWWLAGGFTAALIAGAGWWLGRRRRGTERARAFAGKPQSEPREIPSPHRP